MGLNHELANDLLEIKAIQIKTEDYFTWTSGIKSPIYCDNRLTMSYPVVRRKIVQAFVRLVEQMEIKPDVIAGCATAGIPHAAWLADELNLPMVYVRSKPKGHGKGNQIEGHLQEGQKVVVIEDLISTGGSSIEAAQALQKVGAEVLSVLAIFTYGLEKSVEKFSSANLSFDTITNYEELLTLLVENGTISDTESHKLQVWRKEL
ncbi:orotate phosphoribosyltransferase [Virgibacillus phasianinus]|uniref:Orotate phosphoribosyltransferase n=1 Tax=Virgibacillus phasianinus TaxID=2017483 RepID=A0A220U605_9BACI|nr:orotate phosphoribosyltransferase [Virgibacillus phasianinus]ASK63557.1 orotate phosphoribosyltransferase [Virgibacillus phasianinus]